MGNWATAATKWRTMRGCVAALCCWQSNNRQWQHACLCVIVSLCYYCLAGCLSFWLSVLLQSVDEVACQAGGAQPKTIFTAFPFPPLFLFLFLLRSNPAIKIPLNSHSTPTQSQSQSLLPAKCLPLINHSINDPIIIPLSISNLSTYLSIFLSTIISTIISITKAIVPSINQCSNQYSSHFVIH